jgi:ATP-dependent Clp protease ATP-binding subunit ClpB
MKIVRATFAPEFLNRIDDIILFNRLTIQQMKDIVKIQIRSTKNNVIHSHSFN